jgi:hypothetical protein
MVLQTAPWRCNTGVGAPNEEIAAYWFIVWNNGVEQSRENPPPNQYLAEFHPGPEPIQTFSFLEEFS